MRAMATYRVPEANLDPLRAELTKLNKRAAKLGMEPVTLTVTGTDEVEVPGRAGLMRKYATVTVEGETPKYAGWTFVATLDHASEAGTVVRTVPGETLPVEYRDAAADCDHCHLARTRHETFVVRHDDGTHKHVGRNCLADFLGHKDPHALASFAEMLGAFDALVTDAADPDFFGMGLYGAGLAYHAPTFLADVAAMVDREGWVSRGMARDRGGAATVDLLLNYYDNERRGYLKASERLTVTEAHHAEAERVLDWVAGLRTEKGDTLSDYEHNLVVVLTGRTFAVRNAGIAASAVATYRREMGKLETLKRAALVSTHFGTVGKRAVYDLTLTGKSSFDGNYGPTTIYRFADAEGNVAVWFASGAPLNTVIGEAVRLKATVKCHGEYKGVANTVLTRATEVTR